MSVEECDNNFGLYYHLVKMYKGALNTFSPSLLCGIFGRV